MAVGVPPAWREARSAARAWRIAFAVAALAGSVITTCGAQLRGWWATATPSQTTLTVSNVAVTSTNLPIIRGSTE